MATSFKISEKVERSDHLQFNTYCNSGKIVKIGPADPEIPWLQASKSGAKQNWLPWQHVPSEIGEDGPDQENSCKYLPFGEKIVNIGPVDTEIDLLIVKT